jgi:hypothetical protein
MESLLVPIQFYDPIFGEIVQCTPYQVVTCFSDITNELNLIKVGSELERCLQSSRNREGDIRRPLQCVMALFVVLLTISLWRNPE